MSKMQQGSVRFQMVCFAFGQGIMLLNVASGVLSKYLTLEDASLPTLQSTCLYILLGIVFLSVRYWQQTPATGIKWWYYILLAFVDVEGNYFAVKAYNYANYATLSLILNTTVPFVTVFCFVFLKTRYRPLHFVGGVVALGGPITIFLSDYAASNNGIASREVRGDFYALIAAVFYATSNVMIQAVVKTRDVASNIEVLGFLGLWASIISVVQVAILERDPIADTDWNGRVYGYMTGYVLVLFTFYTVTSVFLRWAESLMFNLSLLTGPVITVAVTYLIFDDPVNKWYWLALAFVYVGLVLYSSTEAPRELGSHKEDADFVELASPNPIHNAKSDAAGEV